MLGLSINNVNLIGAFTNSFAVSFALILAIGPQNGFVIRQGLLRQYLFHVVLSCALVDAVLIIIGVSGIAFLFSECVEQFTSPLYGLAASWLICYGLLSLRSAIIGCTGITNKNLRTQSLRTTMFHMAILTLGNPQVYLDTVILIGAISLPFGGMSKVLFATGTISASLVFFFALGYGASFFGPLIKKPRAVRILDCSIAVIMFAIAFLMAREGGFIQPLTIFGSP